MVSSRIGFLLGFFLTIPTIALAAGPATHLKQPTEWFASAEAKAIATNSLAQQSPLGGWAKKNL